MGVSMSSNIRIEADEPKGRPRAVMAVTLVVVAALAGGAWYCLANPGSCGIVGKYLAGFDSWSSNLLAAPLANRWLTGAFILLTVAWFFSLSGYRRKVRQYRLQARSALHQVHRKEEAGDERVRETRKVYQEQSVRLTGTLIKVKDLLSTLDRDRICSTVFSMLEQGLDVTAASLYLVETNGRELILLGSTETATGEKTVPVDTGHMLGWTASKGLFISAQEAQRNPVLTGLIGKGPVRSVIAVPLLSGEKIVGVINIEEMKQGDTAYTAEEKKLVTTIALLTGMALKNADVFALTTDELLSSKKFSEEQIREKRCLKEMFGRYTSPQVVEELIANPDMLKPGGTRKELTVLFSDIRSFTTFSEDHPPEEVVRRLNEYLSAMVEVIVRNDGTLDKFVGDEIVAVWGAPVDQPDHAELALKAGVEMEAEILRLQEKWKQAGLALLDMGVGINTGDMVVGNIGSQRKMDYTVIGDNVNLGARVEALTRDYPYRVIITGSTYEKVRHMADAVHLDDVVVRGKTRSVPVYGVKGLK